MTNERFLIVILIVFVLGAITYFAFTKFKQDISGAVASPSPSPTDLDFVINKKPTPPPSPISGQAKLQSPSPSPTELPLEKDKMRLTKFPGALSLQDLQNKKAVIQTDKGLIEMDVYPEASMAASNFMILAANGFYNNLIFHRVEDWVIQGGDPKGDGTGGPGYQFDDEPVTKAYVRGIVAMANSGPNTNGSQFFILKKDYTLPPNYTIFGMVTSGMDVVDRIAVGDIMKKVVIQNIN